MEESEGDFSFLHMHFQLIFLCKQQRNLELSQTEIRKSRKTRLDFLEGRGLRGMHLG
jgi:hypothetical protein